MTLRIVDIVKHKHSDCGCGYVEGLLVVICPEHEGGPMNVKRAIYSYYGTSYSPGEKVVTIRDQDGPLSVTNDAERVTREVWDRYKEEGRTLRIFYYDTDGNRDELMHERGSFRGFKPAREGQ